MPPARHVLDYPPQDTRWPRGKPRRTATVTITARISNGSDHRAKLVVCQVLIGGEDRPYPAVAKIYDPLYYTPLELGEEYIVHEADSDYSCEATAYTLLQSTTKPQKPGFIPAYYGSWTFDLSLVLQGKTYKRPVRLILIEHIQGTSLRDLYTLKPAKSEPDAYHYSEGYRLEVLAQLFEGIVRQCHAGLGQHDLSPRNVMVVPDPRKAMESISVPRVVLIDYNQAYISKYTKYGPFSCEKNPLPPNPAQYFWDSGLDDFYGWRPVEWNSSKVPFRNWLVARFVRNNGSKFAPIEKNHPLREFMDSLAKISK